MGQVYRARDTRLGRIVAIKVLPPHRFDVGDFSERFRREARAISSLSHPNICALFDVGETAMELNGQPVTVSYLVMEYLEGETLRARMKRGLPLRQAIDIAVQIANGLAAAHRKGTRSRDDARHVRHLTRRQARGPLDPGTGVEPDDHGNDRCPADQVSS